MIIAYVAGPYRNTRGNYYVHCNIEAARHVAVELASMGIGHLCPHLNSAFLGGAVPDQWWLDLGLALLRRCDLVVVCPDYKQSVGTQAELALALNMQMPVFFWPQDKHKLLVLPKTQASDWPTRR